jgi:enterochelin esterase family protein
MAQPKPDPTVDFALPDRFGRLASARLEQEAGVTDPLDFVRTGGVWRLTIGKPDVDRMEYLFEVADHNGRRATITDPGNPLRAGGAFGDKSVLEFPGYEPPVWLDVEPVPGDELEIPDGTVWAPAALGADEPAPLLVVHDGPEYASIGGFTQYLGAAIATGTLPPVRAALLGPGDRNAEYSANPDYAERLCTEVIPAMPPATVRIGVGVSLGAVAMLHAHQSHPGTFGALFLQSGSFFTPRLDAQERDFSGFAPVTEFVAALAAERAAPVPAVLTCGTVEENLGNNQAMTATLKQLGYDAQFVLRRDSHNYTAWRDALHPHLTGLVTGAAA